MKIGYLLSCEEWGPRDLIAQAARRPTTAAWSRAFAQAGTDELFVNQIGPEQDAFLAAYRENVLPRVR